MASSYFPLLPHLWLPSLPTTPMPRVRTVVWRAMAVRASGDSYLSMWKKAVERERKSAEFERIAGSTVVGDVGLDIEDLDKKSEEFRKILEVPNEERNRVQEMLVVVFTPEVTADKLDLITSEISDTSRCPEDSLC